jgi:hypothetical protein
LVSTQACIWVVSPPLDRPIEAAVFPPKRPIKRKDRMWLFRSIQFVLWLRCDLEEINMRLSAMLVTVALCLSGFPASAENTKHDLFGISPGMTSEEVLAVIVKRNKREAGWKGCTQAGIEQCDSPYGALLLKYATHLPDQPLYFVDLTLETHEKRAAVVKSLTDAFGGTPITEKNRDGNMETHWNLAGGLVLLLEHELERTIGVLTPSPSPGLRYEVQLSSPKLLDSETRASADKTNGEFPLPKNWH